MEMSNTRSVPADIQTTWNSLNDPEFLKDCISGCQSIERLSDTEFKLVMTARVGPVNARFSGRMTLSDLQPPRAYSLAFEGQGGAAGFAKGGARVQLAPEGEGRSTSMTYDVKAQVGGKLAQVGSRLIDGAAKKVADEFFSAFVAKLAASQSAQAGVEPAVGQARVEVEPAIAEAAAGAEVGAPVGSAAAGEALSARTAHGRQGLSRNTVVVWAVLIIAALVIWLVFRR